MRAHRILLAVLLALTAASCARQQQAYDTIDPTTNRSAATAQTHHGSGASESGLWGSPQAAQLSYAQPEKSTAQSYAQRTRASQNPLPQYASGRQSGERGLFNWWPDAPDAAQAPLRQNSVYQYHPPQAAGAAYAATSHGLAPAADRSPYTLGAGDKLRVVVYGQDGISGSYLVGAGGDVSLPLVGSVRARGFTTDRLARKIAERLKQGYVRDPHVTVSVVTYRPFFILGEVTTPGQYPYVPEMTAEKAVAIAGGFTPRAEKDEVKLTRNANGQHLDGEVPLDYPLRPGDTVVVKERWF